MGGELELPTEGPAPLRSLFSTAAAARALGVPVAQLSAWARDGVVRPAARTLDGHRRWHLDELRRQLLEHDTRSGR